MTSYQKQVKLMTELVSRICPIAPGQCDIDHAKKARWVLREFRKAFKVEPVGDPTDEC